MERDPCIGKHGCRSPVACAGFGYCRERNADDKITTPETIARRRQEAGERAGFCEICGQPKTWTHDHKPDLSGLDDGPPLHPPRKKAEPKSADEYRDIRSRAWATRRQKYGPYGHR